METEDLEIEEEISSEEYHASTTRISKSGLDLIDISPLDYWHKYLNPKREPENVTPALLEGKAFHSITIEEAKFYSEFAVMGNYDRRTTVGKAGYAEFEKANAGKSLITLEQLDQVRYMRDAAHKHPFAKELLSGKIIVEKTLKWTNQESGAECKCRPDIINEELGCLVDLKSTDDARPKRFATSALKYRYHVQDPFYIEGANANGYDYKPFYFIAVEKKAPFKVAVYINPPDIKQLGIETYLRNLDTYMDCKLSGNWYGLPDESLTMEFPGYAFMK